MALRCIILQAQPYSTQANYREGIGKNRAQAGSKGIGRFSADSLGYRLRLQTREKGASTTTVHNIAVDWSEFDANHLKSFESIDAIYSESSTGFDLPSSLKAPSHGTVITIEGPNHIWDFEKLIKLKAALAKLINPFGSASDRFRIMMHVPGMAGEDEKERLKAERKGREVFPGRQVGRRQFRWPGPSWKKVWRLPPGKRLQQ